MPWLLQLITDPGCGIDVDDNPEAISIPISYDSLSEARQILDGITPGGDKILDLVVNRSESGEPILWVKISERKIKCLWLLEYSDEDDDDEDDDDGDDDDGDDDEGQQSKYRMGLNRIVNSYSQKFK